MQKHTVTGVVESVGETQTFGSGFQKRTVVIETEPGGKYPSPVEIILTKERCAVGDTLAAGDEVSVEFWLNGRKWEGPKGTRVFCDITALNLTVIRKGGSVVTPAEAFKEIWMKTHGGQLDKQAVAKFVTGLIGKSVKDMSDLDWVTAAKAVEDEANAACAPDNDDLPF